MRELMMTRTATDITVDPKGLATSSWMKMKGKRSEKVGIEGLGLPRIWHRVFKLTSAIANRATRTRARGEVIALILPEIFEPQLQDASPGLLV